MAPSSRRFPQVLNDGRLWTYRDFMKEKLRNRERYRRPISEATSFPAHTSEEHYWVIPDGVTWRKYFPLLRLLVEEGVCNLVLLESAVDLLDYRSVSPCLQTTTDNDNNNKFVPEKPAPQERSKISKLIQQYPGRVFPFCDLSLQEDEHDEFDEMQYSSLGISERSQHALLRAGRMLREQCPGVNESTNILVICTDEEFASKFPSEDGLDLLLVDKFLEDVVSNNNSFFTLKKRCEEDYALRNIRKSVKQNDGELKEYYTENHIQEGMKNKTLAKGRLEVTKDNPKEGFVTTSDGLTYFLNQQLGHYNRAFHHDIVCIKILCKAEWGRPVGRRRLVHHSDGDEDNQGQAIDVDFSPPVPSARVVAIVEPSRRQFITTVVNLPMNDETSVLVIPMDYRIPKIRIKTNAWKRYVGNRLLVQVDAWGVDSKYPAGHCNKIIGPIGDLETEIACLLHEHELRLEPFSAAALASLPPEGSDWEIPPEEIKRRKDLRSSHRIFSVDPPGCQDIDDTMHAKVLPNGDIEIGVHIADVTYFVKHNSPLDLEAQIRGTTFYLVDRRFDMLPSLLSSDLCSLHGNMDRLTVSTIWTFSSDFKEVKDFWYGRTVIHNCQAMTYGQAHNILYDKPPDEKDKPLPPPLTAGTPVDFSNISDLKHDLSILTKLARRLKKDREQIGGAVDLSSGDQGSELKFTLDENNNPTRVTAKKQLEIHNTIAELMILANTWVAKNIHERFPDSALLRNHRSVEDSRFADLKDVLDAGKISFDGKNNMALANSLKQAEEATESNYVMKSLFQHLATRAMAEAQYVCTGQVVENSLSHYGLGLQKYTHFTSPIRRYADIVVHKQLLQPFFEAHTSENSTVILQNNIPSLVPESKTISILGGEGISESHNEQILNDVVTTEDIKHAAGEIEESQCSTSYGIEVGVYRGLEVSKICHILNRQNRMAKMSSMECQSLFLSLYFKKNSEMTKAVVTNLRQNGFWVYIPLFDMKGPVFLSDSSGGLQIDPRLLNLDPSTGAEASLGFTASKYARMIPSGKCKVVESPEKVLEVTVAESKSHFTVRVLDVVTVMISCDSWDVRARIPKPRIHLIADSSDKKSSRVSMSPRTEITSSTLATSSFPKQAFTEIESITSSIYKEILNLEMTPILSGVPLRANAKRAGSVDSQSVITGRYVFGKFRNPDTRFAMQETTIEEAAESAQQRRHQSLASQARSNEYETSQQIERNATARMQRLQAGKRNARKAKKK